MAKGALIEPVDWARQEPTRREHTLIDCLDDYWEEGRVHRERWIPQKTRDSNRKLYRGQVGPEGSNECRYKLNFAGAFTDRQIAQLTLNRPINRVEARKAGERAVARVLQKVTQLVWDDSDVQAQTKMTATSSALDGVAGMTTTWDPDSRMILVQRRNIGDLSIDPAVTTAARVCTDAEYIGWEEIWPLAKIRQLFPLRGRFVQGDTSLDDLTNRKGENAQSMTARWLQRASQRSEAALPRAAVRIQFCRDRQKDPVGNMLFPTGRCVMKAGEVVLWDGPNVYWDGEWPLDLFEWTPDDEHIFGHSNMELLRESQLAFNALMNGTVEARLLTNFMSIIADHSALDAKGWNKLNALRATNIFRMGVRGARFEIVPPPPIAQDAIALAKTIYTNAQIVTGCTDAMLGENPGSLQSGAAIEGLQESASLMTAARQGRMEELYTRVGQKVISRTFQFMTSDRIAALVGVEEETKNTAAAEGDVPDAELYARYRNGFFLDENNRGVTAEDRIVALRDFKFGVVPGSSSPNARRNRATMAGELAKSGLLPGYMVLELGDFPNARELAAEGEAEMIRKAPMMQAVKGMSK